MRFRIISTVLLAYGLIQGQAQAGKLTGRDALFCVSPTNTLHDALTTCMKRSGTGSSANISDTSNQFKALAGVLLANSTDIGGALTFWKTQGISDANSFLKYINDQIAVPDATITGCGMNEYSVGGVLRNTSNQLAKTPNVATQTALLNVDKLIVAGTTDPAAIPLFTLLTTALDKVKAPVTTGDYDGVAAIDEINTFLNDLSDTVKKNIETLTAADTENNFGEIVKDAGDISALNTNAAAATVATTGVDAAKTSLQETATNYLQMLKNISAVDTNTGLQVKNAAGAFIAVDVAAATSIWGVLDLLMTNYKKL